MKRTSSSHHTPDPLCFPNPWGVAPSHQSLVAAAAAALPRLRSNFRHLLRDLLAFPAAQHKEFDVYEGAAGHAVLWLRVHDMALEAERRQARAETGAETQQDKGRAEEEQKKQEELLPAADECLAKANGCVLRASELASARKHKSKSQKHKSKSRASTFICGLAGLHAINALVLDRQGRKTSRDRVVRELLALTPSEEEEGVPDELLYGRAGYLHCLLLVRPIVQRDSRGDARLADAVEAAISTVFDALVSRGRSNAKRWQLDSRVPLMFAWHEQRYLAGAHGLCGIVLTLLQVEGPQRDRHLPELLACVDFLVTQRLPSGNYGTQVDSTRDKSVQWCHGAPSMVMLFSYAYSMTGSQRYLQAAQGAADCVWQRGLLRKGVGLCHGVAGNGYSFLFLHQFASKGRLKAAQQQQHHAKPLAAEIAEEKTALCRAQLFAAFMFGQRPAAEPSRCGVGAAGAAGQGELLQDEGFRDALWRVPDVPLSLFNGLGGACCFLIDAVLDAVSEVPLQQPLFFPGLTV